MRWWNSTEANKDTVAVKKAIDAAFAAYAAMLLVRDVLGLSVDNDYYAVIFAYEEWDWMGTDPTDWMGTDPTERAFFRDFRDVNHQNDLGIG